MSLNSGKHSRRTSKMRDEKIGDYEIRRDSTYGLNVYRKGEHVFFLHRESEGVLADLRELQVLREAHKYKPHVEMQDWPEKHGEMMHGTIFSGNDEFMLPRQTFINLVEAKAHNLGASFMVLALEKWDEWNERKAHSKSNSKGDA